MRLAAALLLCSACGRFGFDRADGTTDLDAAGGSDASTTSYSELVLAAGPRVYLRLGDTSGTVARDSSGHAEDAVYDIQGGVILYQVPGALSTDPDPAVQMDGNSPMTASAQLATVGSTWSGDFTLEMFVQPMATPPNYDYIVFLCETYMVNGFRFGWDAQNHLDLWTSEAGGGDMFVTTQTVRRDVWNHIVLQRQGTSWSIYLDGTFCGSQPVNYIPAVAGAECGFGGFHGVETHAAFDEVALYDRALTAAEIAAHVAAR